MRIILGESYGTQGDGVLPLHFETTLRMLFPDRREKFFILSHPNEGQLVPSQSRVFLQVRRRQSLGTRRKVSVTVCQWQISCYQRGHGNIAATYTLKKNISQTRLVFAGLALSRQVYRTASVLLGKIFFFLAAMVYNCRVNLIISYFSRFYVQLLCREKRLFSTYITFHSLFWYLFHVMVSAQYFQDLGLFFSHTVISQQPSFVRFFFLFNFLVRFV